MKILFTEKKIEVSGDVRAYAEKKINKLDRFFKIESEAFVTFSMERGRQNVELTLKNNGMFFRVSESTHDMYASIDSAVSSIERQVRKNKTRLAKRLREGALEREAQAVISPIPEEEDKDYNIIRTKKFPIKPMNPEEAILQMNLLEHNFFAFRNQENGDAFSVVYKRKDGGYGLIEDSED